MLTIQLGNHCNRYVMKGDIEKTNFSMVGIILPLEWDHGSAFVSKCDMVSGWDKYIIKRCPNHINVKLI